MKLNLQQTAERLGISELAVRRLETEGKLTNLRPPRQGAKKIFRLFDSKEVSSLKNGHAEKIPPPVKPASTRTPKASPVTGILSRLESIEKKVDQLLALWS